MSRNLDFTQLFFLDEAGSVTGSIERVCGIAASNATTVDNGVTGIFHSLKYDDGTTAAHTGSQNEVHQIFAHNVEVHAGQCLDGPFIAVGTSDGNGLAIYHTGPIIFADDA